LTNFFHFFSKKHKFNLIFYLKKKLKLLFFEKNCPLKMGSTNFTPSPLKWLTLP
jgi:hypothetical protein